MSAEPLLSEVEFGGERLALYGARLVHAGAGRSETIALSRLASVRIAFEREPRKLAGALALGAAGVGLLLAGPPLAAWASAAGAAAAGPARGESLDTLIHSGLAALAAAMPAAAMALLAIGAGLAALGWYGRTTLTLAFAATERTFSVRGRDEALFGFAEALGERLAEIGQRS